MNSSRFLPCLALGALSLGALPVHPQNFQDRFEPNDEVGGPTALTVSDGVVEEDLLTVYPTGDVDFYRFVMPAAGQSDHYIEIDSAMSHPLLGVGRVDFALLNSSGSSLATASTPVGSGTRRISLDGRGAGTYLLRVEGRIGSYGWYDLVISLPTGAPPTITTHPRSQTVTAGASVTFDVVASGTAPLSYQWRKDSENLVGQTGTSLTLNSVQASHAGSYTVMVSNGAGNATSNPAVLTVNPAAVAPTITTHPQSQTATAGATVMFNVVATGTPPLSYQWRKGSEDLAGQTGSSLTLANVQSAHAGSYTVVVRNAADSVTSNPATLTVNPTGAPTGAAERVLPAGYVAGTPFTVTLEITAGQQAVAWGVEDQPPAGWAVSAISHGGVFDEQNRKVKWDPFFINLPEDRVRTLTYAVTPPVGTTGGATFDGLASFDGVNAPITGQRTIAPGGAGAGNPPTITTQPLSQTIAAGTSVTLSVTAAGDPPFTYQWRFNRVAIPGAAGQTLTLDPVQATHAGSYTVVVSNAHGNATSQPGILTVAAATGDGPRFTESRFVAREGFRFKLTGPVGRRYALEASTDLRTWIEIATLENPTGTIEFTDGEAVVFPTSCYRVRQIAP